MKKNKTIIIIVVIVIILTITTIMMYTNEGKPYWYEQNMSDGCVKDGLCID